MKKSLNLFQDNSLSVNRFYNIELFYYVLIILSEGPKNAEQIYGFAIRNRNELFELQINSNNKSISEYQINSAIKESILYDFIKESSDSNLLLTTTGKRLLKLFTSKRIDKAEIFLCEKMEKYYGRFSQLIKNLKKNNPNNGLVVFPKPSPRFLNFTPKELRNPQTLNEYCKAFAKYAYEDIKKYMNCEIDRKEIHHILYKQLSEYFNRVGDTTHAINIPREVKKIMYSHYIKIFLDNKFDVRTFDVWCKRAKEFKLINFTEFFPGINSLVIYPVAVITPNKIENNKFILMATTQNNEYLYRYSPKWIEIKEFFLTCLWENYIELSKINNNFFISVQDLRDVVCFKMQISEYSFVDFLGQSYNESINETIKKFKISLEVDRAPEERKLINSKRYPLLINNIPKNIIGIKMR